MIASPSSILMGYFSSVRRHRFAYIKGCEMVLAIQKNRKTILKMLRIFLVFNCVLACSLMAASAEPLTKEHIEKAIDECKKETNLEGIAFDTIEKRLEVIQNDNKCFGGCVMRMMGLINDDGTFNVDVAKDSIPEGVPRDEAVKFIDICSDEVVPKESDDACSTASTWVQCLTTDKNDTKVPWN